MAFLVLLGASGQCIASILCGSDACPQNEAKPAVARKGCCPETSDHHEKQGEATQHDHKSPKGSCCCEMKPAPDLLPVDGKFVLTAPIFLDALLPEPVPSVSPRPLVCASLRIPDSGDSSPPERIVAPDRGRAPPTP